MCRCPKHVVFWSFCELIASQIGLRDQTNYCNSAKRSHSRLRRECTEFANYRREDAA
jgi:hypothetical protein